MVATNQTRSCSSFQTRRPTAFEPLFETTSNTSLLGREEGEEEVAVAVGGVAQVVRGLFFVAQAASEGGDLHLLGEGVVDLRLERGVLVAEVVDLAADGEHAGEGSDGNEDGGDAGTGGGDTDGHAKEAGAADAGGAEDAALELARGGPAGDGEEERGGRAAAGVDELAAFVAGVSVEGDEGRDLRLEGADGEFVRLLLRYVDAAHASVSGVYVSASVLECASQLLHAEADARLHRAEGFVKGERDSLLGEAAEVGELEGAALLFGQAGEGLADEEALLVDLPRRTGSSPSAGRLASRPSCCSLPGRPSRLRRRPRLRSSSTARLRTTLISQLRNRPRWAMNVSGRRQRRTKISGGVFGELCIGEDAKGGGVDEGPRSGRRGRRRRLRRG